jgi:hypothetical protein
VHPRWQLVSNTCKVQHHCFGMTLAYTITNPIGVSESQNWWFRRNSIATLIGIVIYEVNNHWCIQVPPLNVHTNKNCSSQSPPEKMLRLRLGIWKYPLLHLDELPWPCIWGSLVKVEHRMKFLPKKGNVPWENRQVSCISCNVTCGPNPKKWYKLTLFSCSDLQHHWYRSIPNDKLLPSHFSTQDQEPWIKPIVTYSFHTSVSSRNDPYLTHVVLHMNITIIYYIIIYYIIL